jgi:hypothetical protein
MSHEAKNHQQSQGEQDLLPQVGLTKGIDHCLK